MRGFRHGGRYTPTYQTWQAMRRRCFDKNFEKYKKYGAVGITVCDKWKSYANFVADMGERPQGMTLDRIDSSGNYEPSNCRWATPKEQCVGRKPGWINRQRDEVTGRFL